jgi:DNA-binding protein H-NS
MEIDLNELSLAELKALQSRVARAIASYEERRKKRALAELEEKARELGFSGLSEVTGLQAAGRRKPASAAKYANPDNPADTWTGRGRRPAWFTAALAAGRTAEDLAV